MKLIPAILLSLFAISTPVSFPQSAQAELSQSANYSTTKQQLSSSNLLDSYNLKPVTVCVQINIECTDIGSGIYHTKSKTVLTAKHIALGESWFVINGVRLESKKVVFKVKSDGKLIDGIAYNKLSLPASQFGESKIGVAKDLAVLYYNADQITQLKTASKSWSLPNSEVELATTMINSTYPKSEDIPTTMFTYRYRDSLGALVFTTTLNRINVAFSGRKLAGYQDLLFGNESVKSDGKNIKVIGYNTASGQEAFQAYTLPTNGDIKDNVTTILTDFNGVNPIGPGTSGSVVIGQSNGVTILGALVAVAQPIVPLDIADINVISVPQLAIDYTQLIGTDDLAALALLRQTIPPTAVMVWTSKDIESL